MRADRLISLLLLLQTRGRMTAGALAEELGVSERTVYRDVEALCLSGVPLYGEPGREGGYALAEGYRTSLTGLTAAEVQSLFMLSIPRPLLALGVERDLSSAWRKLAAALPDARRHDADRMRQRIHVDTVSWEEHVAEQTPHLAALHRAIQEDRQVQISYPLLSGALFEGVVDPYGLVAKAGTWYLVYDRSGKQDARRASELRDVLLLEAHFDRAEAFDLMAFWQGWCAEHARNRGAYPVTLRVAPQAVGALIWRFGAEVRAQIAAQAAAHAPDAEAWLTVRLSFPHHDDARDRLLGLGRAVEVIEPLALRYSLVDYAQQIVALYGSRQGR